METNGSHLAIWDPKRPIVSERFQVPWVKGRRRRPPHSSSSFTFACALHKLGHASVLVSALRHPRQPHALALTFASGKKRRIVAPHIAYTETADGEARIERKSRLHGGPRLVHLSEPREHSRKMEMRERNNFGLPQGPGAAKRLLRCRR